MIHECTIQSGCARPSALPDHRPQGAARVKIWSGNETSQRSKSKSYMCMCLLLIIAHPNYIYSKTKLMAARFLRQLWRRPGLSLHLLRLSGSHTLGTRAIQPGQSVTSIIPSRDFECELNNKKTCKDLSQKPILARHAL